jgi:hypothetical protein
MLRLSLWPVATALGSDVSGSDRPAALLYLRLLRAGSLSNSRNDVLQALT